MTGKTLKSTRDTPSTYRIRVQGGLDVGWSEWFSGIAVTSVKKEGRLPITTMEGSVVDQAALRGILAKIWDLGMTLISIVRLDAEATSGLGEQTGVCRDDTDIW